MNEKQTQSTEARRRYETLRLAQWAIVDAITAAGHIADRAVNCFDGDQSFAAFNRLREAIGSLAAGPEMLAVKAETLRARDDLNGK